MLVSVPSHTYLIPQASSKVMLLCWSVNLARVTSLLINVLTGTLNEILLFFFDISGIILGHVIMLVCLPSNSDVITVQCIGRNYEREPIVFSLTSQVSS